MAYKLSAKILFIAIGLLNCSCVINEVSTQSHQIQYTNNEPTDEQRTETLSYVIRYAEYTDALISMDHSRRGPLQLDLKYVDEVNRILGRKKFIPTDRYSWEKSYEMFYIYTDFYSDKYVNSGMPLEEAKTRIHKGGPNGPELDETIGYWKRIESMLNN